MSNKGFTAGRWLQSSAILVVTETAQIVANCGFGLGEGLSPPLEEAEANARLISAAPSMAGEIAGTISVLAEAIDAIENSHPLIAARLRGRKTMLEICLEQATGGQE